MAEQIVLSLSEERAAIHVLLWDDQEDLVRALAVVLAAANDRGTRPLLISHAAGDLARLQLQVRNRYPADAVIQEPGDLGELDRLWLLFIQQGTSAEVGPWLNGYRRPLAQAGGTLLVIREAEFGTFQQSAPDLSSFVGPHIYNASSILFVASEQLYKGLSPIIPPEICAILTQLPGEIPSRKSLEDWLEAIKPAGN